MGAVEHWGLLAIPGILAILARPVLASNRSSCIRTIHSRSRDERGLRRHWVEQALLIEANAVLTSSVR
jgi:hypothetical protein